jgi:hypothetical protein
MACVVVLKAYEMFLRGAECTTCCAVRSTTVEQKKTPDDDPRIETRVGVQL